MRAVVIVAIVGFPLAVAAGPVSLGVSLGRSQTRTQAQLGLEPSNSLGLFGRMAVTRRFAAQLEIARLTSDAGAHTIRSATALAIVDLGSSPRLVPTVLGGFGKTWFADDGMIPSTDPAHVEIGVGLEYRSASGLTIGADLRMGTRWSEHDLTYDADHRVTPYDPAPAYDGDYRSGRVTLGVQF
ncbi:MAG: hypothetical protein AB7P03_21620 [Kofleriaceae bacterium]